MDWKKGSVVRLKSGGPNMTVQQVDRSGVTCSWFDDSKAQSAIFAAEALVNGDEPPLKPSVNLA
jgi:uncharacterized protein YodC (DUF2158 family)